MTIYERVIGVIAENLPKNGFSKGLTIDVPKKKTGYDLYSNAFKIFGGDFEIKKSIDFVKDVYVDSGFLNINLKDEILLEFISSFSVLKVECDTDVMRRLGAYIQLAENEKRFCEIKEISMPLTADVRRIIIFLMKIQYLDSTGTKKTDIILSEIIELLDRIRCGCENLKSFVITYEPLLIAVRGSLANLW